MARNEFCRARPASLLEPRVKAYAADRLAAGRFPDHADRVSNALMHVLRLREDGKLELLELN